MILDHFIAGFKARFPDCPFSLRESGAVVVIHGANPVIGDIEVRDDLDELIVFVGDFTHGHFGCYDGSLSHEERHEAIAGDVLSFLADVFADKVEFYRTRRGGGGWRPAGTGPEPSCTGSAASELR